MSFYRMKPLVVRAERWFKNGDHSEDKSELLKDMKTGEEFLSEGKVVRRFSRPDAPWQALCTACGKTLREHGWIDRGEGTLVCPGDWIVSGRDGHTVCKPDLFDVMYEKVQD